VASSAGHPVPAADQGRSGRSAEQPPRRRRRCEIARVS
jgi:hypothetical protein